MTMFDNNTATPNAETTGSRGNSAMAREMVAMWRTAEGMVDMPGSVSAQLQAQPACFENSRTREEASSTPGRRSWIPPLDRMPPLIQFVLHAAHWFRAKCVPGAKPGTQLRLVGQLALGAKRHLSLVEAGGCRFLVGGGIDNVTVIVPIPPQPLGNAAEADDSGGESRS